MYNFVEVVIELVLPHDFISHGHSQGLHRVVNCVVVGPDHAVEVVHHVFLEVHHVGCLGELYNYKLSQCAYLLCI